MCTTKEAAETGGWVPSFWVVWWQSKRFCNEYLLAGKTSEERMKRRIIFAMSKITSGDKDSDQQCSSSEHVTNFWWSEGRIIFVVGGDKNLRTPSLRRISRGRELNYICYDLIIRTPSKIELMSKTSSARSRSGQQMSRRVNVRRRDLQNTEGSSNRSFMIVTTRFTNDLHADAIVIQHELVSLITDWRKRCATDTWLAG